MLVDHRRPIIRTIADAKQMYAQIHDGAARTVAWLRGFDGEPMLFLKKLRFELVGHDPLTGQPLNIVEQLNQTFTILVSLRAVEKLIEFHPDADGFQLALGPLSGRDIESIRPGLVAAEVFSATRPSSNNKLNKEIERLGNQKAVYRYVFFYSPGYAPGRQTQLEVPRSKIQVFAIDPV
jgi:hypothetical protein